MKIISKIFLALTFFSLLIFCRLSIPGRPYSEHDGNAVRSGGPSKMVMGYYYYPQRSKFDHTMIDYQSLTHIAHAFTKPDSQGNLIVDSDYLYPDLVDAAHAHSLKIIMSIGGWGNCDDFPPMASQASSRQRFISKVINFCQTYGYDGVDIDWEFPANKEEQANFALLIRELSGALKSQASPLSLSMAAPSGHYYGKWINYEELVPYFDYIGFMTYDYHGSWSEHSGHNAPLSTCRGDECGSVAESYAYARSRRIPKEKLLLGIPFYGRSFDCEGLYQPFSQCKDFDYSEIEELKNAGWVSKWDRCAQVPYLIRPDKSEIISYDDVRSVLNKCRFVQQKKAAGVIIWEISQDYYQGSSKLLSAIGRAFGKRKG